MTLADLFAAPGRWLDEMEDRMSRSEHPLVRQLSTEEGRRQAMEETPGFGPGAIRALHGSPALFSRFSMGKMGSGEGMKVHGAGHYTTTDRAVAEHYAKTRGGKPTGEKGNVYDVEMRWPNADVEKAMPLSRADFVDRAEAIARWGKENLKNPAFVKRLYERGIPGIRYTRANGAEDFVSFSDDLMNIKELLP